MTPAVELSALRYRYAGSATDAVGGIDALVRSGQVTGLVGPDGAGKTTLMRLMCGLLRPTAGAVRTAGMDPIASGDELRTRLGYMPQKFGLYEDLTVLENLTLYADLRGVVGAERAREFERLLSFTDLSTFTARPAGKLSGGMKQKLGLACVLLGRPEVLLLDEPSVGVDPVSRRELWRMVDTLAGDGLTVLWSTSYLDEAERCAEVLLLNAGALLYAGEPRGLTRRLEGRALLVAGVPDRRVALGRALAHPAILDGVIQGSSLRLVLRQDSPCPGPDALGLPDTARITSVPPRFEDAFVDLLGGGPGGTSAIAGHMPRVTMDAGQSRSVIEAEALTKSFGAFRAADRISFRVPQGEIFGLLGPNGAGKSTTFKMLCGLLPPTSGRASVMGLDLRRDASRARRQLGYMAQKFSLYGNLSVRQNLEFFAGIYGLRSGARLRAIERMEDAFGLGPHRDVAPEQLSLGFRQRLSLSCALMHEPAVLFLDEPTSGVDPITRREFWSHINGLVAKGVTVMVTTHFMDEAEYCDRVGLVYRGRMISAGAPDDLRRSVASADRPDPTMEDAFIALVEREDRAGLAA